ncbi:unnamed protein product [Larinioides sclopetarius]|uniref:C2H2-type domain-containing protein n=1 Tax=Larinioides sclopetarius TaxID=280406 RepID=A0AAV2AMZ3_9ARAC
MVHGTAMRLYPCEICDRKFKRSYDLRRHVSNVHLKGVEPADISKEVELAVERKRDLEAKQASSDLEQNDNSVNVSDDSAVIKDDNQQSSAVEHDDNSSNTCDKSMAEEEVKQTEDGKSDSVYYTSSAIEQDESSDIDGDVNCDNIEVGSRPVMQEESSNRFCLVPENLDKLTCQYCLQKFKYNSNKTRHIRKVHNIRTRSLPPVECPECKSILKYASRLQQHLKEVHGKNMDGTKAKKKNIHKESYGTYIKCIECETNYKTVQSLRDHLKTEHNLNMDKVELRFPNMDAFKKWKHDIERQELTSYTLRHGFKRTKKGVLRNDYVCHRSGKYSTKIVGQRKRMLKTTGTVKLGIVCTSVMRCQEGPDGVVVQYYPHHYGHGKEISFVHLSPEEQDAINENVSKGIPFEKLLDDIKDNQSSTDHFQLYLIKKKDARFISNAYAADEYNPGMGEVESVDQWVRQCCQMENSPILFYRPEGIGKSKGNFLLIIMTEFQKQILMSAAKQVVCVDTLYRKKGGFYLTVLFIMDDNEIAFPVAFCLSNKVDKGVMLQFFESVKDSTGPLSFSYFMSDSEAFIHEAWKEVMEDDSHWLWCMWYVDNRIRIQLKVFRGNVIKKAEAYKTMRTLLECQNANVFESMFKNYVETLKADPSSRNLGESINQRYGKHAHLWAYCYRKDIPLSTNIHLEVLHRIFQFCCREGRKKRLDKFLFVVMKLVKYKMLDRLCNILDEEKTELAIEAINICHNEGLELASERITSLSDKIWLIQGEDDEQNIYVMREFETCPEHCGLRCKECDICVHMYTCSCIHSVINANMCPHIHAVVWKFITPHFSPPPSPMADDIEEQENRDISVIPDKCSELLEEILNRSHEVYKIVRENKSNLPKESLTGILRRLNECIDLGKGREVPEPVISNPQNVLSVVLPNNCQDLSQYVFVLPSNETSTISVPQNPEEIS